VHTGFHFGFRVKSKLASEASAGNSKFIIQNLKLTERGGIPQETAPVLCR
jgi:hypothetical protein